MTANDLPTEEQLANDLTKVARNGVGRSLPRKQGGKSIPYLWDAAVELADDQAEDLPALIANIVVPAVRRVEPIGDREAIAEILWIDLDTDDGYRQGDVPPLGGFQNRYDLAATKLGSTELDVQNNLRRGLLEEVGRLIVAQLEKQRAEAAAPQKISEPGRAFEDEPPFPVFQGFAWKAIELHYSALVALFIDDFAHRLPWEDSFGRQNHYPTAYVVWELCAQRLFCCYVELIWVYYMLQHAEDTETLSTLPESTRDKLILLYEACTSCGPSGIHELDAEALGELQLDVSSHMRLDDPLYTDVWLSWYKGEIDYHNRDPEGRRALEERLGVDVPENQPHNLSIIAAKSAKIFSIVAAEIGLMLPFDEMARDIAYKNIASCYIFDEWTPIYGGKSLREHIVGFIDRKKIELDKM